MSDPAYLPDQPLGNVEVFGRGVHGLIVDGKVSTTAGDVTISDWSGRNTYYHRNPHHAAVVRDATQQAFDAAHGYSWPADLILQQKKWLVVDMNGDVWQVTGGFQTDGQGGIGYAPVLQRFGLLAVPPAVAPQETINLTGELLSATDLGWHNVTGELGPAASYQTAHESTRFDGRQACLSVQINTTGSGRARAFVLVDITFGQDGKPAGATVSKLLGYDETILKTVVEDSVKDAQTPVYDRNGVYQGAFNPYVRWQTTITSFEVFFAEYDQAGALQFCTGRYEEYLSQVRTIDVAYTASGQDEDYQGVTVFVGTETMIKTGTYSQTYNVHAYVEFAGQTATIYKRNIPVSSTTYIHTQTTWAINGGYSGTPTGTGGGETVSGSDTEERGPGSRTLPVVISDPAPDPPLYAGQGGLLNNGSPPDPQIVNAYTTVVHVPDQGTPSMFFEATRETNNLLAVRAWDPFGTGQNIWWKRISVGGEVNSAVSTVQDFATYNPRTRQIYRSATDNSGWV